MLLEQTKQVRVALLSWKKVERAWKPTDQLHPQLPPKRPSMECEGSG